MYGNYGIFLIMGAGFISSTVCVGFGLMRVSGCRD